MARPRKATVTKKRTIIMYSELWHASSCVLEAGCNDPHGASWQFLSSIVLTAFAFEAYLNHVGPDVIKTWPSLERLSPLAKFDLVCELLGLRFEKGKRPRQTIEELFRNAMAHARTTLLSPPPVSRDVNDGLDNQLRERPLAHWEPLIETHEFPIRARKDVEAVLTKIQAKRPEPKESLFTRGFGSSRAALAS
jgi:hypothetical protein